MLVFVFYTCTRQPLTDAFILTEHLRSVATSKLVFATQFLFLTSRVRTKFYTIRKLQRCHFPHNTSSSNLVLALNWIRARFYMPSQADMTCRRDAGCVHIVDILYK